MSQRCLLLLLSTTAAALRVSPLHAPRPLSRSAPRIAAVAAADAAGQKKRPSLRYITEAEMEERVLAAAIEQGVPAGEAQMYASCSRNIYSIGCVYPTVTVERLEQLLIGPAKAGEGWALLMLQCSRGKLPRLRSEGTALARMKAVRAAAARRSK